MTVESSGEHPSKSKLHCEGGARLDNTMTKLNGVSRPRQIGKLSSGQFQFHEGLSYRKENPTALGTFSCRHPLLTLELKDSFDEDLTGTYASEK